MGFGVIAGHVLHHAGDGSGPLVGGDGNEKAVPVAV